MGLMPIVRINGLTRPSRSQLFGVSSSSRQWRFLYPLENATSRANLLRSQAFCTESSHPSFKKPLKARSPTSITTHPSDFFRSHVYLERMSEYMAKYIPLMHSSKKQRVSGAMACFLQTTLHVNKRKSLRL